MAFAERQPGDRRWGLFNNFPLTDCCGLIVIHDRRSGKDRRETAANEEFLKSLAELPSVDS